MMGVVLSIDQKFGLVGMLMRSVVFDRQFAKFHLCSEEVVLAKIFRKPEPSDYNDMRFCAQMERAYPNG